MSTAYFDAVGRRAGVRCGGVFGRLERVAAGRVPLGAAGRIERDSLGQGFGRARVPAKSRRTKTEVFRRDDLFVSAKPVVPRWRNARRPAARLGDTARPMVDDGGSGRIGYSISVL